MQRGKYFSSLKNVHCPILMITQALFSLFKYKIPLLKCRQQRTQISSWQAFLILWVYQCKQIQKCCGGKKKKKIEAWTHYFKTFFVLFLFQMIITSLCFIIFENIVSIQNYVLVYYNVRLFPLYIDNSSLTFENA